MTETTLATFGLRGRRVRVCTLTTAHGTKLVRVEWRENGQRVRESWPDTRDNRKVARGYAEGVAERLAQRGAAQRVRLTVQELVARYLGANDHWRPATLRNVTERLQRFMRFAGEAFPADHMTPEMLDEFRAALRKIPLEKTRRPMVPNQVAHHAAEVKHLYRFGKARKLVPDNPLADYVIRLGKDERRQEMAEYTNAEWAAVLAQFDPKDRRHWRAYGCLVLAGVLGPRQKALRHLTWTDVDLRAREVTWRAATDKVGRERVQPLPRDAVRVFRLARVWRARDGYTGPWVFYPVHRDALATGKPYDYSSVVALLRWAERAAGVEHKPFRALHGLRRTAAGNVLALTSNMADAGNWIGDKDPKSLRKYLKVRDTRQREVAGMVSAPATERPTGAEAPEPPTPKV